MSDPIDDRLDYILKSNASVQVNFDRDSFSDYQNLIPQIKQAFEDAGYIKITATQEQQAALANMMLGNEVMTGQEWYDRFMTEYDKLAIYPDPNPLQLVQELSVTEAARRAAGITNNKAQGV